MRERGSGRVSVLRSQGFCIAPLNRVQPAIEPVALQPTLFDHFTCIQDPRRTISGSENQHCQQLNFKIFCLNVSKTTDWSDL